MDCAVPITGGASIALVSVRICRASRRAPRRSAAFRSRAIRSKSLEEAAFAKSWRRDLGDVRALAAPGVVSRVVQCPGSHGAAPHQFRPKKLHWFDSDQYGNGLLRFSCSSGFFGGDIYGALAIFFRAHQPSIEERRREVSVAKDGVSDDDDARSPAPILALSFFSL